MMLLKRETEKDGERKWNEKKNQLVAGWRWRMTCACLWQMTIHILREKLALAFALLNALLDPPSASTRTPEFVVIFIQHSSLCPRWWKGKSRSEIPIGFIIFVMVPVHVGTTGSAGYQGITKEWELTRHLLSPSLNKEEKSVAFVLRW